MNSIQKAKIDFDKFFNMRTRVIMQNDVYLQRDAVNFFRYDIAPLIYTGPSFNKEYCDELNRLAKEQGFIDMNEVFITMPGK